jgi:hypothetical protein
MNFAYQPKKSDLWASWGVLAFWILAAVLFFVFALPKIAEEPRDKGVSTFGLMIFFAVFFLGWIVFSIYTIIHSIRFKIILTDDILEKTNHWGHGSLDLNRVIHVRWYPTWIVLRTDRERMCFTFNNFSKEQRQQLIAFFHQRFPESVQKGWKKFWEMNWRLFDELENRSPAEIAAAKHASRKMFFHLSLFCWLFLVIVDFFMWHYTGEKKWFFQPFALMIILAFVVYYFPNKMGSKTKGRLGKSSPQPKVSFVYVICFLAGYFCPILLMASQIFPHNSWEEAIAILGVMLVLLSPAFWSVSKQFKLRRQWNRDAAQKVAELYLSPPDLPSK